MSSGQFMLRQGFSRELEQFPHIKEFTLKKVNTIQLDSFKLSRCENLNIYCVMDGKFEWLINEEHQVLYPGNTAVVLPGQEIGATQGFLEIGALFQLELHIGEVSPNRRLNIGKWSGLSENERQTIGKVLLFNNTQIVKTRRTSCILQEMHMEITNQEIGYITRTNHLLDYLLICMARQSTQHAGSNRDFPQTFMKLEEKLRQRLTHQWTVEEMSAMVGLGTTAFTEKVKSHTGFPPLHYLINIRISEATRLLKQQDINITDIALNTGFYSSQHFSTTFKKLTGHTPNEFRKKNTSSQEH